MPLPLIVILGAPNVGKSTLFNRLVGKRRSIVTDEPGATRDRIYGEVEDVSRPFRLVDTGGWTGESAPLAEAIERQARAALQEAAGVLLVVDVRAGPTALDRDLAAMLRRRSAPVILVANKVDAVSAEPLAHEFFDLGMGEPLSVSAAHGLGVERLLGSIDELCEARGGEPRTASAGDEPVRVAIVGRPNVGKSSLVNRLVGEDRVLVSEVPGTTRDAVDTLLIHDARHYLLLDTAGLRRRGKSRSDSESQAAARARRGIENSDVVVLVLDALETFGAQDAHIAGHATKAHRPLLVAVNKWDVVEQREGRAKEWERTVRERLRFAKNVPVVLVSARTGRRVLQILDRVDELHAASGTRVPTPQLNRWLREMADRERSSPAAGRSVRLLYAAQTGVRPPRFVVFCNDARRVHFSMRRFLENSLRERFGLGGSPIDLRFRSRRRGAD